MIEIPIKFWIMFGWKRIAKLESGKVPRVTYFYRRVNRKTALSWKAITSHLRLICVCVAVFPRSYQWRRFFIPSMNVSTWSWNFSRLASTKYIWRPFSLSQRLAVCESFHDKDSDDSAQRSLPKNPFGQKKFSQFNCSDRVIKIVKKLISK